MSLVLKPRDPLPAFSFTPASASPPLSPSQNGAVPAPKPPADFIPERDMNLFGAYPLAGSSELGRGLVTCQRCGKVVMELALADHTRLCSHVLDGTPLTVKKGVKGEKGLKSVDGKKRRASDFSGSSESPTKKRVKLPDGVSPDDEEALSLQGLKKGQIKKLQKEQARLERKAAKAQEKEKEKQATAERKRLRDGPIDLDRQCGVINHKGLPCSRSIICKNHGVGLKRAVVGRTKSYDDLVLDWQRNHNPNFKEPPGKKEREAKKAEKKERDKQLADEAKRRKGLNWEDDDGFDMDAEEGKREMAELVHVAKVAGERVCPKVHGSVWISVIGGGFSGVAPKAPKPPGPGGVGTGTGVWRAGNYEFAQVGDMLTKALAARPKPPPVINIASQKAQPKTIPPGAMGQPPTQVQQYPVATM